MKELFEHGLPQFSVYEVFDLTKGEVAGHFSTESLANSFAALAEIKLFDIREHVVNDSKYYEQYLEGK